MRVVIGENEADRVHAAASVTLRFAAAGGNTASTVQPAPGVVSISIRPPASAVRSSMLSRPMLRP